MGRQRWTSRFTVEECFSLSVVQLGRMGLFTSRIGSWWTFKQDDDAVKFTLVEVPDRAFGLRFNYDLIEHATGARTPIQYVVEITTTRPHFGGCRYWFRCPWSAAFSVDGVSDGFICLRTIRTWVAGIAIT